jgi:hypothetical protein
VAVLSRRLEPEPGPLYQAGQHLARAAQLDRHQRRPPAATRSAGRPLLVDVARLVAHSPDPAQMAAIAAAVLLVYGLVLLLDHVAARQQAQAAVRRQLQLATNHMAEHALVSKHATDSRGRPPTACLPSRAHPTVRATDVTRGGRASNWRVTSTAVVDLLRDN